MRLKYITSKKIFKTGAVELEVALSKKVPIIALGLDPKKGHNPAMDAC